MISNFRKNLGESLRSGNLPTLEESIPNQDIKLAHGSTKTGEDGLAILPHLPKSKVLSPTTLFAQKGKDIVFLQNVSGISDLGTENKLLWHVFDDRSNYKPKEEIHVKGYVRQLQKSKFEHFPSLSVPQKHVVVHYSWYDGKKALLSQGNVNLNTLGAFDIQLTFPDSTNLGKGHIHFKLNTQQDPEKHSLSGDAYTHYFSLEEFKKQEVQVETKTHSKEESHILGEYAIVKTSAKYFAGGNLSDSAVTWKVTSSKGTFVPPGLSKYTFGTFYKQYSLGTDDPTQTHTLESKTNEKGSKKKTEFHFLFLIIF